MSGAEMPRSLTWPTANGIAVRVAGLALGFVVAVVLARNLAARDLGTYQGVLSVCIILGGLASATAERPATRRISALDGAEPAEIPREIAMAHLVAGIATLAIVVLLVVGSLLPAASDAVVRTLRFAALMTPGIAVLSLRQWIALPLQGVAASLGPEQIGQPLLFLCLVGFASYHADLGPFEALLAYASGCWLVWLVSSWRTGLLSLLRRGIREPPSGPSLRQRFREGSPFVLLAAVGVLPVYATVPLVAVLLDLADAGRLAIALQFTGLVTVPLQIVSLAIMPQSARLHRDADTEALDSLVRTASTISLASGVALAAMLLVSLDTILEMLGPSFGATSRLVPVLVVGQLVNAALGPNGPTLQMIGLEREMALIETGATLLRFLAVAFAASAGSIVDVALALAATTALRNLLLSFTLHRRSGILTLPQLRRRHAH